MLKFYGASDDLVEIDGDIREEIGCYEKPVRFRLGDVRGGCFVIMQYAVDDDSDGVWRGSVEQITEDTPIPWPITIGVENYSVTVNVDCPAATPIMVRVGKGTERGLFDESDGDD